MKIITIRTCQDDCLFFRFNHFESIYFGRCLKDNQDIQQKERNTIPEWCTLDEYNN